MTRSNNMNNLIELNNNCVASILNFRSIYIDNENCCGDVLELLSDVLIAYRPLALFVCHEINKHEENPKYFLDPACRIVELDSPPASERSLYVIP